MARLILICVIVSAKLGVIFSHEKSEVVSNTDEDPSLSNTIHKGATKSRTLFDYQTRVVAHKDLIESRCLIEFLKGTDSYIGQSYQEPHLENLTKNFFMTENQLSKRQIWTVAGQRVVDFCRGFPTYLLHDLKTNENSILQEVSTRTKRSSKHFFVGRVRGQTQSQYLNFANSKDPGKAEAESSYGSSKAAVSGTSGMGQAQSQSIPVSCDECYGEGYDQEQTLVYGRPGGPEFPTQQYRRPGRPGYPTIPGVSGYPGEHEGIPGFPSQPKPGISEYPVGPEERPGRPTSVLPGHPGEPEGKPGFPGRPTPGVPGYPEELEGGPGFPGYPEEPERRPALPGRPTPGVPSHPGESERRPTFPGQPVPGVSGYPEEPKRPVAGKPEYPGTSEARPDFPDRPVSEIPGYPERPESRPTGPPLQHQPVVPVYPQPQGPSRPGYPERPGLPGYPTLPQEPGQRIPGYPSYPTVTSRPGYPVTGFPEGPPRPGYPAAPTGPIPRYPPIPAFPALPGYPARPGYPAEPTYPISPGYPSHPGYPSETGYPSKPTEPQGPFALHRETGGTFNGKFAGDYGAEVSQRGKFSGVFSGEYEAYQNGKTAGKYTVDRYPAYPGYPSYPGQPAYPGAPGAPLVKPGYTITPLHPGGPSVPPGEITYPSVERPGYPQPGEPGYPGGPFSPGPPGYPGLPVPSGKPGFPRYPGIPTAPEAPSYPPGVSGRPSYPRAKVPAAPSFPGYPEEPGYPSVPVPPTGPGYPGTPSIPVYPAVPAYPSEPVPPAGPGYPGAPSFPSYPGTPGYPSVPALPVGPGYPGAPNYPEVPGYPGGHFPSGGPVSPGAPGYPGVPSYPGAPTLPRRPPSFVPRYPSVPGPEVSEYPVIPGPGIPGYPSAPSPGTPGYPSKPVSGYPSVPGYPEISGPGRTPPRYTADGGEEVDDSDSQVLTAVQQTNNETQASASAQGKYAGGIAQSQVSGTYSGSGSFSASAGSDDGKKGALSQVSGGKEGAMSSAQGRGGLGQSQAQVQLASETGDTISSAQTGGWNHGSQTQVQASGKGGMADAQSNGPGSTSSQAQIGFQPYEENERTDQATPFRGGGMASAQSGTYSGQAQSQIQGKFQYGIRYTGAAQAGSGAKDSVALARNQSRPEGLTGSFPQFKPLNFTSGKNPNTDAQSQVMHTNRKSIHKAIPADVVTHNTQDVEYTTLIPDDSEDTATEEYHDDDYEDYDNDYTTQKPQTRSIITQASKNQRQHIILDPLEDLDATVQRSYGSFPKDGAILQPGEYIPGSPGYQIPTGFRGRVKAIANGPNTYALGKNSQAQSVTLTPGTGRIIYKKPIYAVSSNSHQNSNIGFGSGYTYQPASYHVKSGKSLPHFVSLSTSETGSKNPYTGQKTPKVYYAQSSTCGVFTNTCVFNGSGKLCFPKPKTNPDGTFMTC